MSYAVIWTSRFKKDYKLLMKQGADMSLLDVAFVHLNQCNPSRQRMPYRSKNQSCRN